MPPAERAVTSPPASWAIRTLATHSPKWRYLIIAAGELKVFEDVDSHTSITDITLRGSKVVDTGGGTLCVYGDVDSLQIDFITTAMKELWLTALLNECTCKPVIEERRILTHSPRLREDTFGRGMSHMSKIFIHAIQSTAYLTQPSLARTSLLCFLLEHSVTYLSRLHHPLSELCRSIITELYRAVFVEPPGACFFPPLHEANHGQLESASKESSKFFKGTWFEEARSLQSERNKWCDNRVGDKAKSELIETLEKHNSDLTEQLRTLRLSLNSSQTEADQQIGEYRSKLNDLTQEVRTLQRFKDENSRLGVQISQLQQHHTDDRCLIDSLNTTIDDLHEAIKSGQRQFSNFSSSQSTELTDLKEHNMKLLKQTQTLSRENARLAALIEDLTSRNTNSLTDLKEHNMTLLKQTETLTRENTTLTIQIEDLTCRNRNLMQELQEERKLLQESTQETSQLSIILEEIQPQLEKNNALTDEVEYWKNRYDTLLDTASPKTQDEEEVEQTVHIQANEDDDPVMLDFPDNSQTNTTTLNMSPIPLRECHESQASTPNKSQHQQELGTPLPPKEDSYWASTCNIIWSEYTERLQLLVDAFSGQCDGLVIAHDDCVFHHQKVMLNIEETYSRSMKLYDEEVAWVHLCSEWVALHASDPDFDIRKFQAVMAPQLPPLSSLSDTLGADGTSMLNSTGNLSRVDSVVVLQSPHAPARIKDKVVVLHIALPGMNPDSRASSFRSRISSASNVSSTSVGSVVSNPGQYEVDEVHASFLSAFNSNVSDDNVTLDTSEPHTTTPAPIVAPTINGITTTTTTTTTTKYRDQKPPPLEILGSGPMGKGANALAAAASRFDLTNKDASDFTGLFSATKPQHPTALAVTGNLKTESGLFKDEQTDGLFR